MTQDNGRRSNPRYNITRRYQVWALIFLSLSLWGVIPLMTETVTNAAAALGQLPRLSSWHAPVLRSFVLLLICAPVSVVGGFILGSKLADARIKLEASAGLMLLPILLGGGVNAFVFKLCFAELTQISDVLQNRNLVAFWSSLLLMVLWQYLPCVTFLCWWSCSQISSDRRAFAVAHQVSFFERLSDIYWPQCRSLIIYLLLLVSAACAAEYERTALIFRASEGTGTELFSHWLLRAYFTVARIDPALAGKAVLAYSVTFILAFIPVAGMLIVVIDGLLPGALRKISTRRVSWVEQGRSD